MLIHYEIKLDDGTLAESTLNDAPMEIHLDDSPFPDQINQLLKMLDPGMETDHVLLPHNGWGERDGDNIHFLPRSDFASYSNLHEGMIIEFNLPNGESLPGAIIQINDEQVEVDFNHPFAGQILHFYLKRIA